MTRTVEEYKALRSKVRELSDSEIVALRDANLEDTQLWNCCVVALAARGIYDLPVVTAEETAREEAALRRAHKRMN